VSGAALTICAVGNAGQRPQAIPPSAGSGARAETWRRAADGRAPVLDRGEVVRRDRRAVVGSGGRE